MHQPALSLGDSLPINIIQLSVWLSKLSSFAFHCGLGKKRKILKGVKNPKPQLPVQGDGSRASSSYFCLSVSSLITIIDSEK